MRHKATSLGQHLGFRKLALGNFHHNNRFEINGKAKIGVTRTLSNLELPIKFSHFRYFANEMVTWALMRCMHHCYNQHMV